MRRQAAGSGMNLLFTGINGRVVSRLPGRADSTLHLKLPFHVYSAAGI